REPGSRHDLANALAGYLLRGRVDESTVVTIVEQAAKAAGDEEWKQRVADVRTTANNLASSHPVTGGPTLAELFGAAGAGVLGKLRDWLGIQTHFRQYRNESLAMSAT